MTSSGNVPRDPNCIFCKITAGEIPCYKVFEDETVVAFLDISPLATGHVLVVPKAHHVTVMNAPPEVMAGVGRRIPAISRAVLAATGAKACHVLINNGPEAMQSVGHLHWHIIPRQAGDSFRIPWHTTALEKEAAGALLAMVKAEVGREKMEG